MRLPFTKMHGLGNDFVVFDATRAPLALSQEQLRFVGDRRFGIGADQILVVEDGQVAERGTHAELMALDGRYRQLHDRQYAVELDRFINPGEDFTPEPAAAATASAPRR